MRVSRRVSMLVSLLVAALLMGLMVPLAPAAEAEIQAGDPLADIVFVIDESGSMGSSQRDVRNNVDYIAERVDAFVDARFGLVGFGASWSHGTSGGRGHPHTASLTGRDGLASALGGLITSGGTEPGVEATVVALEELSGYRRGASTCVVLVTDEDADHPIPMDRARQLLAERNGVFFGIVAGYGNTSSTYGALARETGGLTESIGSFRTDPTPVLEGIFDSCVDSAAVIPGAELFGDRDWAGHWGDPVNLATGNFFGTWTDLDFPDQVFGMDVTRSYNSLDPSTGAMGTGWVPPFASGLAVLPSGDLVLLEPDGRRLRLVANGDGTFTSPPAFFGEIVATADGYRLDYDNGETWTFDAVGDLLTRADWTGQVVTYTRDDQGRVTGVDSSTGYGLTLSHDADGRLVEIVADDGRTVAYGYDTDGSLAEVVLPDGGVQRWLTDDQGRVVEIRDPDDRLVLRNTYDDAGRVVRQEDPAEGASILTYDGLTTTVDDQRTGERLVYVHTADGRLDRIVDPLGEAVDHTYDADGNLTEVVDRRGASTTQTFDDHGNVLSRTDHSGDGETFAYDDADRLISRTDAAGSTWTVAYDGAERIPATVTGPDGAVTEVEVVDGLITSITDADGVTDTFAYDDARNVVTTTNGTGDTTTLGYDDAGHLTEVSLSSGATTSMTVDAVGRVTSETDAAGATTTTAHSPGGQVTAVTDPTGATTTFSYDDAGRLVSQVDANGDETTYAYDAASRLVAQTRPGGATTAYDYGPLGRLETITGPEGGVTEIGYDVDGAAVSVTDPAGDTVTRDFDVEGRLVAETDGEGHTTGYAYDVLDRLVQVTHPDGTTETIDHDAYGRVVATVDPRGGTETRDYTAAGRLAQVVDPVGAVTRLAYDAAGRVVEVTGPAGGTTSLAYTVDGHLASETSPAGLTTTYGYDRVGRLAAVTDPAGNTTTASYTLRGELARLVDPTGAARSFAYDPVGRLVESVDPNGGRTSYGYDARGNRTSRTNAAGHTETWVFDLADRMVASTDPAGNTTTASWDAAGRIAQIVDPSGRSEQFTHDGRGLVTARTFGDGTTVSYGYDALGRRTSMTDATGQTAYAHDPAGNLTEVTTPDGDTVAYAWDLAGRRTSTTYPDGRTVSRDYDARGLLTATTDDTYGTATFAYDADGRLVDEQLPDGGRDYGYDDAGRLAEFDQQVDGRTDDIGLTWDAAGRLATQANGTQTATYDYDPSGQLLQVAIDGGLGTGGGSGADDLLGSDQPLTVSEGAYAYDAAGNRTAASEQTHGQRAYEFDPAGRLVAETTEAGTTTYTYDAAGRRIGEDGPDGSVAYGYDARGLLTEIVRTHADGTTTTETRTLDGDGRLQSAALAGDNMAKSTDHTWDIAQPVPQLVELDRTVDLPGRTKDLADQVDLLYGASGRIGYVRDDGTAGSFATDVMGSAIETTSTTDLVAGSIYTAYGTPTEANGHSREDAIAGQFGFRGELDTSIGLHLRAREYDTDTAQFLTVDPLDGLPGLPVETSPYHYANNDPVNWTDPLGLSAMSDLMLSADSPGRDHLTWWQRALGAEFLNVFGFDDGYPFAPIVMGLGKISRIARGIAPIFQTGIIGRRLVPILAGQAGRVGQFGNWLGSPAGRLLTQRIGIVGGVVGTATGAYDLYRQGNPVDAYRREGAGYVADVAGTAFSASTAAFLVAPNPVTGAAAIGSGLVWAGAETVDHWDDITEFGSDVWDGATDIASDVASGVGGFASEAWDGAGGLASGVGGGIIDAVGGLF